MSNRKKKPATPLVLTSPTKFLDLEGRTNIPSNTLANARTALHMLQADGGLRFSYDEFADRRIIGGQLLGSEHGQISDDVCRFLRVACRERFLFEPGAAIMFDAISLTCRENSFHPIKDYLSGLRWDRKPRIGSWLIDYMSAPKTPLVKTLGELVLVASVRRILQPGCKFDLMPVLESPEGRNKSSGLRTLYGAEYFSDQSILGLDDKQVQEAVRGRWGIECAEMAGHRKGDLDRIKAQMTREVDRTRPAYGRAVIEQPRTCVFWGTTNEAQYLRSQNGNRRFVPVPVGMIDRDGIGRDRDQLWAEAYAMENFAESLALPPELWADATAVQESRTEGDPWLDILANVSEAADSNARHYCQVTSREGVLEERISSQWLLRDLLGIPESQQTSTHTTRVGNVMRKLGWSGPGNVWISRDVKGFKRPLDPFAE